MSRNVWLILVLLGLVLQVVCTIATADGGPDYYAVTGVAANGVLNIRAEPSAKSRKIGEIPHDARGLQNLGCTGGPSFAEWLEMTENERQRAGRNRWCKVRYRGKVGWVAGRYLMEDSNPPAIPRAANPEAADNLKAFPPPAEGMVRHILQLPKLDDESLFKVELIVGKTVLLDSKNSYFFGGAIEEETIEGWGFPKYVLKDLGPMGGTLMAVDPNEPKVSRFVTVGGEPYLIRYNSRLPVVVYVPEGAELRYRIWRAESEMKPIEKG